MRFILLLLLGATLNAGGPVSIKGNPTDSGGYFDPHNHLNGVLPYKLWGAIGDVGREIIRVFLASSDGVALKLLLGTKDNKEATLQIQRYLAHHTLGERGGKKVAIKDKAFLTGILDRVEEKLVMAMWNEMASQRNALLTDPYYLNRLGPGTKNLEQVLACSPKTPKNAKRLLQQLLTATPQTDFDTAYVARGLIKTSSLEALFEATLDELHFDEINYVELSHPITRFTDTEVLSPAMRQLIATYEQKWNTEVRWLPMLLTNVLADLGNDSIMTLNRVSGECSVEKQKPFLAPLLAQGQEKSLLEKVLEDPLVVGVDLASPERSCYTKRGADNLKVVLERAFGVAKRLNKRLVVHIHVGEGYPAFSDGKINCNAPPLGELPAFPIKYKQGLPVHYLVGSQNIEILLGAVSEFRHALGKDVGSFDNHIQVRFGHVTHATMAQAQSMSQNNIWADVNLTSNLATGALTIDSEDVTKSENVESFVPKSPGSLRKLAQDPNNAALFKKHSLYTLLTSGVRVVLGTDGGGIEHSSMPNEYELAKIILNDVGAPGLFNMLYTNQKVHYDFIHSKPQP